MSLSSHYIYRNDTFIILLGRMADDLAETNTRNRKFIKTKIIRALSKILPTKQTKNGVATFRQFILVTMYECCINKFFIHCVTFKTFALTNLENKRFAVELTREFSLSRNSTDIHLEWETGEVLWYLFSWSEIEITELQSN